jgi:hypothetical protein
MYIFNEHYKCTFLMYISNEHAVGGTKICRRTIMLALAMRLFVPLVQWSFCECIKDHGKVRQTIAAPKLTYSKEHQKRLGKARRKGKKCTMDIKCTSIGIGKTTVLRTISSDMSR